MVWRRQKPEWAGHTSQAYWVRIVEEKETITNSREKKQSYHPQCVIVQHPYQFAKEIIWRSTITEAHFFKFNIHRSLIFIFFWRYSCRSFIYFFTNMFLFLCSSSAFQHSYFFAFPFPILLIWVCCCNIHIMTYHNNLLCDSDIDGWSQLLHENMRITNSSCASIFISVSRQRRIFLLLYSIVNRCGKDEFLSFISNYGSVSP